MILRMLALTDDPKRMVLEDGRATDPTQQALLHSTFEPNDGHLVGCDLDGDWDFASEAPWESDEDRHGRHKIQVLRADDVAAFPVPRSVDVVVAVSKHDKDPCKCEAQPVEQSK